MEFGFLFKVLARLSRFAMPEIPKIGNRIFPTRLNLLFYLGF
jgi:hypothetical protein